MVSVPDPDLQIGFAAALSEIRGHYLQNALSTAVGMLPVPDIDRELAAHVPAASLTALAAHGLRGEVLFPVPLVLATNPRLIGYYRLLYGYSRKEFYAAAGGAARFAVMEDRGVLPDALRTQLPALCSGMCRAGALLLAGIGGARISAALLDDLTLLTLGPQLRGGANVRKGTAGLRVVFEAIHAIVQPSITSLTPARIEIRNAAGRLVLIEFSADPDIVIRERMRADTFRHLIAIEVKAGSDVSNIHNRIGEAEKSHQKARARGFSECWTVVNVDTLDMAKARQESPSTNRFYRVSDLVAAEGDRYRDFRDRVVLITGIPGSDGATAG